MSTIQIQDSYGFNKLKRMQAMWQASADKTPPSLDPAFPFYVMAPPESFFKPYIASLPPLPDDATFEGW